MVLYLAYFRWVLYLTYFRWFGSMVSQTGVFHSDWGSSASSGLPPGRRFWLFISKFKRSCSSGENIYLIIWNQHQNNWDNITYFRFSTLILLNSDIGLLYLKILTKYCDIVFFFNNEIASIQLRNKRNALVLLFSPSNSHSESVPQQDEVQINIHIILHFRHSHFRAQTILNINLG